MTHIASEELRRVVDPLTGAQVVVNPSRQSRPNLPDDGCPFCPGGREAPEPYDVRYFPNRWPALGDGCCEVVLYSPEHDASFWSLGQAGARRVVDLWCERTIELGARDDVQYVLIFENRGQQVGATISHPHGQIYAFDSIPPAPLRELESGTVDLPESDSPLMVATHGDWHAWVPSAAIYPYELRIACGAPTRSLAEDSFDRDGFAAILVDCLARLDQQFSEPTPYMLWIHQAPTDHNEWSNAAVHVHITPLRRSPTATRYVAAAELGAEVYFNPVDPQIAAGDLRAQPGAS